MPLLAVAFLLVFATCDQPPAVAPDDVGIRAAPGGGGGKPEKGKPNPTGCADGQVAKWDDASTSWLCAADQTQGDTGYELVSVGPVRVPVCSTCDKQAVSVPVACSAGKKALSGGYEGIGFPSTDLTGPKGFQLHTSRPYDDASGSGWLFDAWLFGTGGAYVGTFWAVCAYVS